MRALARAVIVLATTAGIPLLTRLVRLLTRAPRVNAETAAGITSLVTRPRGPARAATVFLNGGTALGCDHPAVRRLTRGLARAGYLVVAPELPGLRDGELTPATLAAVVDVARATADRPEARDGRVALFGVSAGASLALLAAADDDLQRRVSVVVSIAPYADLDGIVRLATTGFYGASPRATAPLVREVLARSLAACGGAEQAAELLANGDPARYDELHACLPPETRAALAQLSPLRVAGRVDAPLELAAAPDDCYFPLAEAETLAEAAPHGRLTVTSMLDHVRLRPSLADLPDALRFWRFTARALAAAASPRRRVAATAQPLRFLAVGAGGYGVTLLGFAALYAAGAPYAAASAGAYLVASALMYLGNRYFTFRLGHEGFWRTYRRYLAAGLAVAAANVALLAALVQGAGLDPRAAQALSLLLLTPAAFVLFKRWTFRLRPV